MGLYFAYAKSVCKLCKRANIMMLIGWTRYMHRWRRTQNKTKRAVYKNSNPKHFRASLRVSKWGVFASLFFRSSFLNTKNFVLKILPHEKFTPHHIICSLKLMILQTHSHTQVPVRPIEPFWQKRTSHGDAFGVMVLAVFVWNKHNVRTVFSSMDNFLNWKSLSTKKTKT